MNKDKNKEIAFKLAEEGNDEEAKKYFTRSLNIKSKMIFLLMDILAELKIQYVVAPYEADAQMAYMVK